MKLRAKRKQTFVYHFLFAFGLILQWYLLNQRKHVCKANSLQKTQEEKDIHKYLIFFPIWKKV